MLKSPNVKEEQKTCNLATVEDCIEETQPENGIYITYILRDFAKIELTIEMHVGVGSLRKSIFLIRNT